MDGCEDLDRYNTYEEYRKQVLLEKFTKPESARRILTEEEFDELRWGIGMADARNDEEHRELVRRMNATEARIDGALGHIYGAEGHGGILDTINTSLQKVADNYEHLDRKFDALILKQEQDNAHIEHKVSQLENDVNNLGNKIRASGVIWKKFRDAGIGAAAVAVVAWLFNRISQ
jgi:hypothetical protein